MAIICYHMVFYTEFIPDEELQYNYAWSHILLTLILIAITLSIMIYLILRLAWLYGIWAYNRFRPKIMGLFAIKKVEPEKYYGDISSQVSSSLSQADAE